MTEKTETHAPCDYHKSIVDNQNKFVDIVKTLREENREQGQMLARVETAVLKINETLIGTFDRQGMIGRVDGQIKDILREVTEIKSWGNQIDLIDNFSRDIEDLKAWRDEIDSLKKTIIGKIIVAAVLCFAAVVGAAFVIVKIYLGV